MSQPADRRSVIVSCKLDDGSIKVIHAASKDNGKDPESYGSYRFIGVGVYYEVDGVRQPGTSRHRFYREN